MRRLVRMLVLAATAAGTLGAAGDPQPAPQAPAGTPAQGQAATPAPTATPAPDIEDFVPSEKVKADDAVAFPTDI